METERIRQGATFEVTLKDTDLTALTATITVSDDTGIIASDTANYEEIEGAMFAVLRLDTENIPVGDYSYMYTITYEDNVVVKLPRADGCSDGECELPAFIVCLANDIEES